MVIKTTSLTPEVLTIVKNRATEYPFSGEYNELEAPGTYLCRQCGLALFRAQSKFPSGCGWPSFDQNIASNVASKPDPDGLRTEIVCARCSAHLGHVFSGEGFTNQNTRHCVNSISLDFIENSATEDTEEAILAAGCFWGVEYYFKRLPGILKVEAGYTGGSKDHPSYQEICEGNTGHYEAIRVLFDPQLLSYEAVIKYFFEIHDPAQKNGQGPDIGEQYKSGIFYFDETQKNTAEQVITQLKEQMEVATELLAAKVFWPAEKYHQDYYSKTGKSPYCHHYVKRF